MKISVRVMVANEVVVMKLDVVRTRTQAGLARQVVSKLDGKAGDKFSFHQSGDTHEHYYQVSAVGEACWTGDWARERVKELAAV